MFKETTRPIPFIMDIKSELPDLCQKEVISPLHYGETLEIAFVKGIEGEIFINGKRFEFKEKNVFVTKFYQNLIVLKRSKKHFGVEKQWLLCYTDLKRRSGNQKACTAA